MGGCCETTTATAEQIQEINSEVSTEFVAGNIKNFVKNWEALTNDTMILNIVRKGLTLNFWNFPQDISFHTHPLSHSEKLIIDLELQKLIGKGVIRKSTFNPGDFVSGYLRG